MNKTICPRFLTLKVKTWHSVVLTLIVLFSSLLLVESKRRNEIIPQADAATYTVSYPVNPQIRSVVLSLGEIQFGKDQVESLDNLLTHEANFQKEVKNPTSGACGIFQSDPCSKILSVCGSLDNISCQIDWGFNYIKTRYGTPHNAWLFWQQLHFMDGQWVHYY